MVQKQNDNTTVRETQGALGVTPKNTYLLIAKINGEGRKEVSHMLHEGRCQYENKRRSQNYPYSALVDYPGNFLFFVVDFFIF